MKASTLKISAAAFLPSVATMLFVQACGGSGDAVAQATPDPMVGVWDSTVTQRDCTSNAVVATFRASMAMHQGGTLTGIGAAMPALQGPSLGLWSKNADGTYAVKFKFYRFNADGTPGGTTSVSSTRTLTADTNTFNAVTRNEMRDAAGNLLASLCASDVGTRAG